MGNANNHPEEVEADVEQQQEQNGQKCLRWVKDNHMLINSISNFTTACLLLSTLSFWIAVWVFNL